MSYPLDNSILVQKDYDETPKKERRSRGRLQTDKLKDVPLEVRRRDAREPLFLTRYE